MDSEHRPGSRATGACLCGSVRYAITGELRDVLCCHCERCRRTHGHVSAYASTRREDRDLLDAAALTWHRSETDEKPNVRRGFCRVCGSSLFWDPRGRDFVCVSAGTLHAPTGAKPAGYVWLSQAGDYHEVDDGLPTADGSSQGRFLAR